MNPAFEKFILKSRPYCEMPSQNGAPLCARQATRIVVMRSERWHYNIAICDQCADYLEARRQQFCPCGQKMMRSTHQRREQPGGKTNNKLKEPNEERRSAPAK
jgi:hypothetical protein